LLAGVSGYAAQADAAEWLEDAHGALAWALLAVVIVHVAGVALSSLMHRENLVGAMITGRKRGAPAAAIRGSRWVVGAALVAVVLALWLEVVPVPGLEGRPRAARVEDATRAVAGHQEDD
jgi:hypothetical protein